MKPLMLMLLSEDRIEARIAESTNATFANTPEGQADFLRWLSFPLSEARLLIDLPAEEFRRESAPHLTGRRHQALLQRKLDLLFRGLTFRLAERQTREPTNRRDDILLLSALQNPEPLQSWLDTLRSARIPLRGVYSLAQLGIRLLGKSSPAHVLLVSWQAAGGLRQSYYQDRQLVFSRLTATHGADCVVDAICADLPETCRYLASVGLLPDGATIEVRIIGKKADWPALRKRLPGDANRHDRFLSLESLHQGLGVGNAPDSADATQFWLSILSRHPPSANYAQPAHTQIFRLQRTGLQLKYAGITALIPAMLCAGWWHWQAAQLENQSRTLQKINQGMQHEVELLAAGLSDTAVTPAEMRSTVEWARHLEAQAINPKEFLLPMSRVFDRHPNVILDELSWQVMNGTLPAARIHIECHLDGVEDQPREALASIERFRADLAEINRTVQPLRLPAGSNPGDSLENPDDTGNEVQNFALEITWQRPG